MATMGQRLKTTMVRPQWWFIVGLWLDASDAKQYDLFIRAAKNAGNFGLIK